MYTFGDIAKPSFSFDNISEINLVATKMFMKSIAKLNKTNSSFESLLTHTNSHKLLSFEQRHTLHASDFPMAQRLFSLVYSVWINGVCKIFLPILMLGANCAGHHVALWNRNKPFGWWAPRYIWAQSVNLNFSQLLKFWYLEFREIKEFIFSCSIFIIFSFWCSRFHKYCLFQLNCHKT